MDKAFPDSLDDVLFGTTSNLCSNDVLVEVFLMLLVPEEYIDIAIFVKNETILVIITSFFHLDIK